MSVGAPKIPVVVAEVVEVNALIKRFRFVRRDGACDADLFGRRACGGRDGRPRHPPDEPLFADECARAIPCGYEISVRRDEAGRGGSLYMHNHVRPGMEMVLSQPVNLFPLDARAKKHLLIAGGIGITPFVAQMAQLEAMGGRFELHYSVRSPRFGGLCRAFARRITALACMSIMTSMTQKIDLKTLLKAQPLGTHIYVCGPKGMIAWVHATATAMGWPDRAVHSEEFLAPPVGLAFEVKLAASGKTITVQPNQSLLEAIEAAGVDAPYLCRGGACGQCETDVLRCDGHIEHNDHWLTRRRKRPANTKIMPCVSRFRGHGPGA